MFKPIFEKTCEKVTPEKTHRLKLESYYIYRKMEEVIRLIFPASCLKFHISFSSKSRIQKCVREFYFAQLIKKNFVKILKLYLRPDLLVRISWCDQFLFFYIICVIETCSNFARMSWWFKILDISLIILNMRKLFTSVI